MRLPLAAVRVAETYANHNSVSYDWRPRHAQFAREHLRGDRERFGKGRKGKLKLCQLLNAHICGHGDGGGLDYLRRIFAQNVSTQDVAALPLSDKLAEALIRFNESLNVGAAAITRLVAMEAGGRKATAPALAV